MNDHAGAPIDLQETARAVMTAHGFEPEFSAEVQRQLAAVLAHPPSAAPGPAVQDLRHLPWSSIDNDTSRDLDQIEYAERLPGGAARVLVGIADVDAFVPKGSAIDAHAAIETTTVYAGVRMFPMLPEALSTGATSLLEGGDKLSVVTEFVVGADGHVTDGHVYLAIVRNAAQLTYDAVGAWLEGKGPAPAKVVASNAIESQLRLQDEIAGALRADRHRHGALNIETIETRPVIAGGAVVDVVRQERTRASDLIEDFMIAANETVARLLEAAGVPSLRRVVKVPERWDRIVQLAADHGDSLPPVPDSKALNEFLLRQQAADPERFTDLSLGVIKLMGPGEYVLERPGQASPGHFGLAVDDYTHSTAPNRRFADLVTQRLIKAVLAKSHGPYTDGELAAIARACTLKQDSARKVEREMTKRLAAAAMSRRVGEVFDALVTGRNTNGTFVRVLTPHVEGMLVQGAQGVDVGDRLRVKLVRTDVGKGYIDFVRVA